MAAGVGIIVDDDCVVSNLQRQVLFSYNDLGRPKVEVWRSVFQGKPISAFRLIIPFVCRENIKEVFNDYLIVVDGSDNFPTRYFCNMSACVLFDKILIHGSIENRWTSERL